MTHRTQSAADSYHDFAGCWGRSSPARQNSGGLGLKKGLRHCNPPLNPRIVPVVARMSAAARGCARVHAAVTLRQAAWRAMAPGIPSRSTHGPAPATNGTLDGPWPSVPEPEPGRRAVWSATTGRRARAQSTLHGPATPTQRRATSSSATYGHACAPNAVTGAARVAAEGGRGKLRTAVARRQTGLASTCGL